MQNNTYNLEIKLAKLINKVIKNDCFQTLPQSIHTKVVESNLINAFAFEAEDKRDCITITTAALTRLPDEEVEAIIAHELGHHLCNHNNSNSKIKSVVLILFLTLFLLLIAVFTKAFFLLLILIPLFLLSGVLKKLISAAETRRQEYEADKVASTAGYSVPLFNLLSRLPAQKNRFYSTHPSPKKRISALKK